jgi:prepilin-type processing-associated H-X9-DG protein
LIELLVVVAVIAILASMLLPALAKARDTAKSSQCTSRLRDFAMWSEMYRDDYADFYLPNSVYGTGYLNLNFVNGIAPYLGPLANTSAAVGPAKNYFLCPSSGYVPKSSPSSAEIYANWANISTGWRVCNYMINAYFGYGNLATQTALWHPKRHTANINPSLQVYHAEIKTASPQVGYYNITSNVIHPHRSGASTNLSFIDGHVESRVYPVSNAVNKTIRFY